MMRPSRTTTAPTGTSDPSYGLELVSYYDIQGQQPLAAMQQYDGGRAGVTPFQEVEPHLPQNDVARPVGYVGQVRNAQDVELAAHGGNALALPFPLDIAVLEVTDARGCTSGQRRR